MTSHELAAEFWFCAEHRRVEAFDDVVGSSRIGLFPTGEQRCTRRGMSREREKAYGKRDSAWEDGD
jgi:hypothetical protein